MFVIRLAHIWLYPGKNYQAIVREVSHLWCNGLQSMPATAFRDNLATDAMRIVVVADYDPVRTNISALLQQYPKFHVVSEAHSGAEGVREAVKEQPDVVVIDVRIQDMSSADAVSEILHQVPKTRVILLSGFAEDKRLQAALGAGASGYVLKRIGIQDLADRIEAILRSQTTSQ